MLGLLAGLLGFTARGWSRQLYAGTPRLRESDRDRLFGGSHTMFAFADVMHFFPDEFSGLRAGRFALTLVALRSFQRLLVRHGSSRVGRNRTIRERARYSQ